MILRFLKNLLSPVGPIADNRPASPEPKANFPSEKWGVGDLAVALQTWVCPLARVDEGHLYRVNHVIVGTTKCKTEIGVGLLFEGEMPPDHGFSWNAKIFRKAKLSNQKASDDNCVQRDRFFKKVKETQL